MTKVGRTTHKYYKETRGIKVSGGQVVKAGTVLTREGHRWKAGQNVVGLNHLTSTCSGEVRFTQKRGKYKRAVTYIHVVPQEKKTVKAAKSKE
ncbi:MAG: 50S ribosomal protein L27 [Candidatus Omnitrophota bacterium]